MIKLTPPMGWNSWNTFGENINEKMIFETADVMAESGLRDKGYEYLVIDDCWSLRERDENGRLVPDEYSGAAEPPFRCGVSHLSGMS